MDNTTPVVSTPSSTFGTPSAPRKKGNRRGLVIAIIIAIVLGALFFIFKPFGAGSKAEPTPTLEPTQEPFPTEEEATPTPEESPTPTTKPKPTSGPVTSAQTMHIQVLNGTGEVGIAGQGASFLQDKGYTNVETGNADTTDAQGVTVQVKSSLSKYTATLITDLKGKYSSVSEGTALSTSSDFDAIVTIGK